MASTATKRRRRLVIALSLAELARRIVAENAYLTLATADADGRPWATPVWFAADDLRSFCWASKPGARHSVNLASRSTVGISIFDSRVPSADAVAVYVEAEALEVGPAERPAVLALFNERAVAQGLPAWDEMAVTGSAKHRLYRARATRVYVLDDHDERIPVSPGA